MAWTYSLPGAMGTPGGITIHWQSDINVRPPETIIQKQLSTLEFTIRPRYSIVEFVCVAIFDTRRVTCIFTQPLNLKQRRQHKMKLGIVIN